MGPARNSVVGKTATQNRTRLATTLQVARHTVCFGNESTEVDAVTQVATSVNEVARSDAILFGEIV